MSPAASDTAGSCGSDFIVLARDVRVNNGLTRSLNDPVVLAAVASVLAAPRLGSPHREVRNDGPAVAGVGGDGTILGDLDPDAVSSDRQSGCRTTASGAPAVHT